MLPILAKTLIDLTPLLTFSLLLTLLGWGSERWNRSQGKPFSRVGMFASLLAGGTLATALVWCTVEGRVEAQSLKAKLANAKSVSNEAELAEDRHRLLITAWQTTQTDVRTLLKRTEKHEAEQ